MYIFHHIWMMIYSNFITTGEWKAIFFIKTVTGCVTTWILSIVVLHFNHVNLVDKYGI